MIKISLKPSTYFLIYFAFTTICCLLSTNKWYFLLVGMLVSIIFTVFKWKERLLPFIFTLLIFISFLIGFFLTEKFMTNINFQSETFRIQELKPSYLILRKGFHKYYLSRFELPNDNVVLNQKLIISGTFEKLNLKSNYYEFDFQKFLNQKQVYQELKLSTIFYQNKGWLSQLNLFYQRFLNNDLAQVFLLNNRDKTIELNESINSLGIGYLLNFSGIPIFLLSYLFKRLMKRFNVNKIGINIYCLSLDLFLLFFAFTLNFPFILTRVGLTLLVKNILSFWRTKTSNLAIWVIVYSCLISLDNSLIQTKIFLYYLAALIFLKYNPLKSFWKQIIFNLIICNLSFGVVNMIVDYRFYYLNEVFDLLFAPILGILNIFVLLSFWIPKIVVVYNFIDQILVNQFIFLKPVNIFYACGFIPLYWYLFYFSLLKVFLINQQHEILKWSIFSLLIISIIWLFVYKLIFFKEGMELLNVGNGQSLIFKQRKKIVLFDVGVGPGQSKNILPSYLNYYGIQKIDCIFISHFHDDHYNQFDNLIKNNIKIKEVVTRENAKEAYRFSNAIISIFNRNQLNKNENNNSLVYLVNFNHNNFLIMSDLEQDQEQVLLNDSQFVLSINANPIDYMLLGHHGSKTSSSYELLSFIKPKIVFISGENRGMRKFPNEETIKTLNDLHIPYKITNNQTNYFFK
ncbi:ComEC/Rec2 family competence protein [Mesoplasma lactucae]|uniref:Metallo-beta-lactamase domain-containing protein n=1 Tax=Mesoplasma lactucae ATCC 49193 TaxID=81460 RepID=A0A291IRG7_9MOLU|nr:MBL fold metallo-hydrolase [Mesoplasma lactucae]ATG97379.1 hypothetical protein CP520_01225 [Mesoplasma lactucae ATCC 49193]ATZ20168.1 competence protein ComEC [Mesoplasma lactucae ATCC 49193]MCL8216917.1 hypothetical protein [Mesoplasma lactucae ATCC 49193]